jgi:hypothetical protein
MDSKKVIEKLIKIAQTQQKIIEKLAQQVAPPGEPELTVGDAPANLGQAPAAAPNPNPPATNLKPSTAPKTAKKTIWEALPHNVQAALFDLREVDNEMHVRFNPGQQTQANYDAVLKTMQDLTNKNMLQHAYSLKVV